MNQKPYFREVIQMCLKLNFYSTDGFNPYKSKESRIYDWYICCLFINSNDFTSILTSFYARRGFCRQVVSLNNGRTLDKTLTFFLCKLLVDYHVTRLTNNGLTWINVLDNIPQFIHVDLIL